MQIANCLKPLMYIEVNTVWLFVALAMTARSRFNLYYLRLYNVLFVESATAVTMHDSTGKAETYIYAAFTTTL